MNSRIARQCYVTDAVRIGKPNGRPDRVLNRQLIKSEIKALRPELVVLVGKTASNTIESECEGTHRSSYFCVPFPTKRRSRHDVEKAKRIYEKLHAHWNA